MRFDPQGNYVSESSDAEIVVETGSPLKVAVAIVVIGFVAGGALWIVSEGVPDADGRGRTGLNNSLIEYAESVVRAKTASEEQPPPAESREPVTDRDKTTSRREFAWARASMGMGRDEQAVQHLKKAIRLDPGYADAHYRLGLTYVKLGDHAAARREQAYLKSLDVDDLANLLGHLVDN